MAGASMQYGSDMGDAGVTKAAPVRVTSSDRCRCGASRYLTGACQKTGCSPAGEAVKPTPVSVLPATARPVMAWMPGPVRPFPAGSAACQDEPLRDVHTTTFWWPGVLP